MNEIMASDHNQLAWPEEFVVAALRHVREEYPNYVVAFAGSQSEKLRLRGSTVRTQTFPLQSSKAPEMWLKFVEWEGEAPTAHIMDAVAGDMPIKLRPNDPEGAWSNVCPESVGPLTMRLIAAAE